jgi:arsenate reductase
VASLLFVCQHGGAKSLIAAEYFNRLARVRGLSLGAESAGIEPYAAVPDAVVVGLARDGFDVQHYVPRRLEFESLANASCVVSFGCEIPNSMSEARIECWDDVPMVSDGFARARDVIVARVSLLIEKLARLPRPTHEGQQLGE